MIFYENIFSFCGLETVNRWIFLILFKIVFLSDLKNNGILREILIAHHENEIQYSIELRIIWWKFYFNPIEIHSKMTYTFSKSWNFLWPKLLILVIENPSWSWLIFNHLQTTVNISFHLFRKFWICINCSTLK